MARRRTLAVRRIIANPNPAAIAKTDSISGIYRNCFSFRLRRSAGAPMGSFRLHLEVPMRISKDEG
ncbi:hypothetical protein ATY75_08160 [Rhizobium sp. N122]|nr:hypothetical protein ATY75_08160 [Rhizobium sp. N122]